jgi:hypothetical protein
VDGRKRLGKCGGVHRRFLMGRHASGHEQASECRQEDAHARFHGLILSVGEMENSLPSGSKKDEPGELFKRYEPPEKCPEHAAVQRLISFIRFGSLLGVNVAVHPPAA